MSVEAPTPTPNDVHVDAANVTDPFGYRDRESDEPGKYEGLVNGAALLAVLGVAAGAGAMLAAGSDGSESHKRSAVEYEADGEVDNILDNSPEDTTITLDSTTSTAPEFVPDPESSLTLPQQVASNEAWTLVRQANEAVKAGDFSTATTIFGELHQKGEAAGEDTKAYYDQFDEDNEAFSEDNEGYRRGLIAIERAQEDGEKGIEEAAAEVAAISGETTRALFVDALDLQLTNVAEDAASEGDFDKADEFVDQVDDAGIFTTDYAQDQVDLQLNNQAVDAAREGDFDEADELVEKMDNERTFTEERTRDKVDYERQDAAKAAAREGDFDEADELAGQIDDEGTWTAEKTRSDIESIKANS